ncbi:glycosyltransferase [Agilicoccus flavus]|uniref:glycosyltransferase n=1 Tax=Agilicoccus flavus TaxID=2775968 RepID=UPI001CF6A8FA|nr:glycosyltransferase [Agilicoccus flavus]
MTTPVTPAESTPTTPAEQSAPETTPGLVSVIMPALNEEASIEGAVRSALEQADVDVEVLVVDGRSSDATAAIVTRLAQEDPRVRLLDNPQVTIPAALNVGLAAARGEFVGRIDAHATVSPDYLARGVAHLRRDAALAGVGGLRRGVSDSATGRAVALALSSPFGVGDSINHFGTSYQLTDHASFGVYRTDVARGVGGWDETLLVNEDVDFDHRILATGATLGFEPAMHIDWHVRRTAAELARQYRRYGRGKAAMARKNGRAAIRPRHLAAPVAVVGTAGLALLGLRFPRFAAAAYSPYVLGLGVATAKAWSERDRSAPTDLPTLPASFAAMHYGWGLGFIEGYVFGRTPRTASGDTRTR